ncbi:MAG: Uma2 family endonuclease [Symploca sp. SIO1B1]|nr:Uma2 family endonuclease [Symploca sp. SIO1B1]
MILTVEELAVAMPDVSDLESCEPPMESPEHYKQLALLMACLDWILQGRDDIFTAANLSVYYSEEQLTNKDFRGPDLFVVKDVKPRKRASWVVWHEDGRYPDFILELLSPSTSNIDKGLKKELYQSKFRTPEYFWFSPITLEFAGFRLMAGKYEPIEPDDGGRLWSEVLGLSLGIWEGKLRFFRENGELVLTPEEIAIQQQQRAEQQQQRAEQQQQRAEQQQQRAEQQQQRAEQQQLEKEQEQQKRLEAEAALEELLQSLRDRGINPDDLV